MYITKVTNNNQRAEQRRGKKLQTAREKKRSELGLVKPDPRAAAIKHAAYSVIQPKDEPTIAWMMKQKVNGEVDFYSSAPTPYYTATTILEKAQTLSDPSSLHNAAQFLHTWREQSTPFQTNASRRLQLHDTHVHSQLATNASQQRDPDRAFRFA